MELASLGRVVISFAVVVVLMLLVAYLAKKFGLEKRFSVSHSASGRLKILDQLYLDPRQRLVLMQRDDTCHLLLLGAEKNTLLESFPAQPTSGTDTTA
ncbi:MAG: flagellar biosynthetic protein FliO [Rickettsiales bacterium]